MFLHFWFFTCCPHSFSFRASLCFIIFILSLCSNMLNLENILEYILILKFHSGMKCLHVFFSFFHPGMKFHPCISSQDEISCRQKRVNCKRHFTVDRDDFIQGRVSSRDEISRVNTILVSNVCGYVIAEAVMMFCKKDFLKNLAKFTGKTLYHSLFFNKIAGFSCFYNLLIL